MWIPEFAKSWLEKRIRSRCEDVPELQKRCDFKSADAILSECALRAERWDCSFRLKDHIRSMIDDVHDAEVRHLLSTEQVVLAREACQHTLNKTRSVKAAIRLIDIMVRQMEHNGAMTAARDVVRREGLEKAAECTFRLEDTLLNAEEVATILCRISEEDQSRSPFDGLSEDVMLALAQRFPSVQDLATSSSYPDTRDVRTPDVVTHARKSASGISRLREIIDRINEERRRNTHKDEGLLTQASPIFRRW